MINDLPPHRIDEEISAGSLLEAGIVSGLVFRPGGFQPNREVAALVDASLYMHALERGYTVLTRNIRDFDFINQIVPSGRMLYLSEHLNSALAPMPTWAVRGQRARIV